MTDLTAAILTALEDVPACSVRAFEKEEQSLPVIAVSDENVSVFARADGAPYLEEHTVSLHVYAADSETLSSLSALADAAMTALGLMLTGAQGSFNETIYAWEKTLRYRCLIHQDTIYQ